MEKREEERGKREEKKLKLIEDAKR